jgi:phospholipid-binding lipoprotein MlaA
MLPLLGPSSPTAAIGTAVDMLTRPTMWVGSDSLQYTVTAVGVVDTRVQLLDAEELITGDRYTFLRDAYVQRRNYLQADGVVEDAFLDDEAFEGEPE